MCEEAEGRYVGDLNLLTLAAFNCKLGDVKTFDKYDQEQVTRFRDYAQQFFSTDIPTAYIVGFEYFLGTKIVVNEHTLIPRFETEELVINLEQRIRNKFEQGSKLRIADICSGSGVIGVSLFTRLSADYELELTFSDISAEALEVTKLNATMYGLDANYLQGDMLKPAIDSNLKFDVIVSNPPYIAIEEQVQNCVIKYEPNLALYADDSGLALYKLLINDIIEVTNEKFCLMLEIGETQAKALNKYLYNMHGLEFEVIQDMNKADRNLYLEV